MSKSELANIDENASQKQNMVMLAVKFQLNLQDIVEGMSGCRM
jgi:hypothetical protein